MKVYCFDGVDTIVANSLEQAKEFYVKETGFTKEDLESMEIVEKDMNSTFMWYQSNELSNEIASQCRKHKMFHNELFTEVTLKEAFEMDNQKVPYIIASTEM